MDCLPPVTYEQVYFVEAAQARRPLNPIAIKPSIQGQEILWNDTGRGVLLQASHIVCEYDKPSHSAAFPDRIVITLESGATITLTALDLDLYYAKLKQNVAGQPNFETDQELRYYYLHTDFEA